MPRLMDALSFFIDAPNFVVRSCAQGSGRVGRWSTPEAIPGRFIVTLARQAPQHIVEHCAVEKRARSMRWQGIQRASRLRMTPGIASESDKWQDVPMTTREGVRAFSFASLSLTAPMSSFGSMPGRPAMAYYPALPRVTRDLRADDTQACESLSLRCGRQHAGRMFLRRCSTAVTAAVFTNAAAR